MSLPEPELKKIKLTDLSPNHYNPQEMPKDKYKGLVGHMRSVGFTDPLKIRPRDEGEDPEDIKTLMFWWMANIDYAHSLRYSLMRLK